MLLAFRQQLELTDDQVKRLQALQGTAKPKAMAADQLRARADLMDAMQGDGNLSAARTALDKMSRLRNDQMIERLKARQDARAVLTPAQRTKLDNVRSQGGRRSAALGGRRGQGRPQAGRENFRQGGQGRGMQRPGMMGPGMRGPGMGGQMGPGMAPRGRRGGEAADTRSR
jgi:Spy/CpxP family protein refolding chaperone